LEWAISNLIRNEEDTAMFAQVNGTELYYHTHGQGRPMLLMHGGLGLDHTAMPPTFDALGDEYTLIYYDHRGNGRSARPASFDGITHDTWADDADALRAQLGYDRIIVFGHSYGGFLAQEYALRYGDHLAGLILCCTAPAIDYMDVVQANALARGTPAQLAALTVAFSRPLADETEWRATWRTLMPLYFKHYDPQVGAAMDAATIYSAAAWNHVNANCLPVFNTLARLGEIDVPTLVISGAVDWITPPAQGGERLRAGIPNAELVVFEESGHWPFLEESERFQQVVRDWVSRLG
jgi:proline iminopeptidase